MAKHNVTIDAREFEFLARSYEALESLALELGSHASSLQHGEACTRLGRQAAMFADQAKLLHAALAAMEKPCEPTTRSTR